MAANESPAERDPPTPEALARSRRPLTIDIPAKRLPAGSDSGSPATGTADEPTAASTEGARSTAAKGAPARSATGATADGDTAEPPSRSPGGGFNMLVFAVIGAVVVLAGGYLLMFTDMMPPPGRETAETALAEAARIETELAELRTVVANTPAPDLAPLNDRVAELERLSGNIAELADVVDDLALDLQADRVSQQLIASDLEGMHRDILSVAAAAGDPEAAAQLGEDMNELSLRMAAIEVAAPTDQLRSIQQRLDSLYGEVAALTTEADALAADADDRNRAEAAARALTLGNLLSAADRGDGFIAELAVLSELGVQATLIDSLQSAAAGGVASRSSLADQFPTVADAILDAVSEADPEAGFWERLWDNARGVVRVQPTVPVEGDTPPAIISRMQAAIETGDLEAALGERFGLPEAGRAASAEWAAVAAQRIALDAATIALADAVAQRPQQ